MDNNNGYIALLIITAIAFFLQIQWLFLASIFMFFAIVFSQSYSALISKPAAVEHGAASIPEPSASAAPAQPQPIIVVNGGDDGIGFGGHYFATMLGMLSAADVLEKKDVPKWSNVPFGRATMMRQNFLGHGGAFSTAGQGFRKDYSNAREKALMDKLDKIADKLDGKADKHHH